jgi:fructose-bisphosphate aldolase class II
VKETGVDLLAPAVGNIHGMLKNAPNPRLDIPRIRAIREAAGIPLVLHGGSGISDEDFVSAIDAGVSVIHISTEIRVAWRRGIENAVHEVESIAPYKLMENVVSAVQDVVQKRLKLFSKI